MVQQFWELSHAACQTFKIAIMSEMQTTFLKHTEEDQQ